MKRFITLLILLAGLGVGLVLALIPNTHGDLYPFLPKVVKRWVNEHDEYANFLAFLILSMFALCSSRKKPRAKTDGRYSVILRTLENRAVCVVGLMSLVCAIEFAQRFIPGRVADWRDVCAGWGGIITAWLFSALYGVRARQSTATRNSILE